MRKPFFSAGQSLIEILLAIGLMAVLLPAIIVGVIATREGKPQEKQRLQATALLVQTQEAMRSIREKDWTSFATNGTFHPVITGSTWSLVSGAVTLSNGFTQSVVISDVARDSAGAITTSGGTIDPSTKKVVITIAWTQPYDGSVSTSTYLTRYLNTTPWIQTTQADFNTGTNSGTVVTNSAGGEVTLGSGGIGSDWCQPSLSQTSYSLPGAGLPNIIHALPGNAYVGTNGNSSGDSFGRIGVTFSGNGTPSISYAGLRTPGTKTNDIWGDSQYGYLATTKGIVVVNISTLQDLGVTSPLGKTDTIFVVGTVGYATAGNTFYTLDLSNIQNIRITGQVGIAGTGQRLVVIGSTAFVAENSTTTQLQVINIANASSPSIVRSISVGNNQPGADVAINPSATRAYLITSGGAGNDFFIIDLSTGSTIGTYNTNGMSPLSVAVATGNRVIIVGSGGETYQVLNITNEAAPTLCGGLTTAFSVFSAATVLESNGNAYSYVVSGDTNQFWIIQGGAGNGRYVNSGVYTSGILDTASTSAFNAYKMTYTSPSQTTLNMQLAAANAVNNSCAGANFSYIGPDKTSNTYFTASNAAIPFMSSGGYQNPGRCFRYKLFFSSTDLTQTPVFDDMTVSYTP